MIQTKQITLTPADVRRILRRENSRSVFLWTFTIISFVAVAVLTAYGYSLRRDFAILKAWVPFLGCVMLWWIFMLGIVPWSVTYSKNLKRLFSPMRLTFSPNTIRQESADGAVKEVPLTSIARANVRNEYAVIHDRDGSSIIVPFNAFNKPEEEQQVRMLLTRLNIPLDADASSKRRST